MNNEYQLEEPEEKTLEPEEKLYVAVVRQAIIDYIKFRKPSDYRWFFSDDCKQICEWININPSWIIRLIRPYRP